MSGQALNLAAGVRGFGRSAPRAAAVLAGERQLSFGSLHERSNRLASAVLARGVKPGEHVALLCDNRIEFFEIATALAKVGVAMVPLNTRNLRSDNEYILGHSGCRGIFYDESYLDALDGLIDEMVLVVELGQQYERFVAEGRDVDPNVVTRDEDPYCIAYTSGTTGRPKGVKLTHRRGVLTSMAVGLDYDIGPGRNTIVVAPMYAGAGFSFGYAATFVGASASVLPRWDPEILLDTMVAHRTDSVFLVPTHAQQIRAFCDDPASAYDLSALSTLYFNAAALPIALKEWVIEAFPGVRIHELYASTECSVVASLRPEYALSHAGSVGHPWLMNEIRLKGDDGQEVSPGVPGELFARSPMLLGGYLHDEEATRAGYDEDGFFTVGDVAVRDEDGFISIVDRKKDMIISGGFNIYPRELEEIIAHHPCVEEVAVVGVPDDHYGERVTAFVVPRRAVELDLDALRDHVDGRIARHKLPREWHILESLPRNASGKVLKRVIKDDYAGADAAAPHR